MDKIKVIIADDHLVVREGIHRILDTASDIEVVAEAFDGLDVVEKANELQPHVVLMDIRMPGMDGIEATRRIKSQSSSTSVIILTAYDNESYMVNAIRAGAGGYLLKDTTRDLLIHTIRAVHSGGMLVKSSLLREAMLSPDHGDHRSKSKSTETPRSFGLTSRENEVLALMIRGKSNKEIGRDLSIAEDTAKKHVQTIMMKMQVSDRTQAAVKAVRTGFFDPLPDEAL
ncbi:MAG: response regulator transcription factor [Chloroflexi bacterium]|nr:response regulator transcription factor [Chloroflexota bacterium]